MYKFSCELIRKRRVAKKLSYRALAKLTMEDDPEWKGVTAMTCQRVESGADPSVRSLILICTALGVSPKSVFVKEDSK